MTTIYEILDAVPDIGDKFARELTIARMAFEAGQKYGAAQLAVRDPMTDVQIEDLRADANRGYCIEREEYFKAFRDAEAAHGILPTLPAAAVAEGQERDGGALEQAK